MSSKMFGREWCTIQFGMHCDCIDLFQSSPRLVVGLSSLEGNTWDGAIKIIDEASGQELLSRQTAFGVSTLCLTESENTIVVGSDDGSLSLFTADALSLVATFLAHQNIVSRVISNPASAEQCISCGWDSSIFTWDLTRADDTAAKPLSSYLNAHHGIVSDVAVSPLAPSGLASIGRDGFVRFWDLRESRSLCTGIVDIGSAGSCVAYSTTSAMELGVGTEDGRLLLLDVRMNCDPSNESNKRLAFESGVSLSTTAPPSSPHTAAWKLIASTKSRIRRIISLPDSSWATTSDDCQATVIDREGGCMCVYAGHTDYVTDAGIRVGSDADGFRWKMYTTSSDGSVRCFL